MPSRHTTTQRCVRIPWRAGAGLALLATLLVSGACSEPENSLAVRRALAERRAEVAMREVLTLAGDLDGSGDSFGGGAGGGSIRISNLSRSGSGGGGGGGAGGGATAGGPGGGSRQSHDGDSNDDDAVAGYTFHLNMTTHPKFFEQTGIAWHELVDFGDAPVVNDVTIFYMLGEFPAAGLHVYAADPTWMSRHLNKVKLELDVSIPDDTYRGYAVIDWEYWQLQWDRLDNQPSNAGPEALDKDWKDDWRDYISSVTPGFDTLPPWEQERMLRETYDATAKEFYLSTIELCTQRRPQARWGVWGYPPPLWIDENEAQHRALNDELAWLWNALTAVTPHVYAHRYTVADGEAFNPARGENSETENREYILRLVQEAVRVAAGKPVAVYFWARYLSVPILVESGYAGQFVNDLNLKQGLELPAEGGADGVIIWYGIRNEARFNEYQTYVTETLVPAIKAADAGINGAEH